ncbi:hypothetical protein K431DRAFT_216389 [Polychaeton citri CBS 116435]|uniref:RING-type domain-containing protein n=1 Tax=Polychaeton citri CBS 116435 TaxID=1314669 RepID=A0A9P4QEN3_9PEZI|nr:hypothetical protein K431DRAFT_216389 [Polychaeton citri CBS 116435]
MLISQDGRMVPLADLMPLTRDAVDNIPTHGLAGAVYKSNDSSYLAVHDHEVVLISCDVRAYAGNIGPLDVFSIAENRNVTAVVWYTQEGDYCDLSGIGNAYWPVYSLKNATASQDLLNMIEDNERAGSNDALYASVLQADQLNGAVNKPVPTGDSTQQDGNSTSSGAGQQKPSSPAPSTAVAMIILYSITGIITALFLIVIVTGAVRAHRHPERYGPRNIIGRSRQSRARGMARAMLDSLPIVKFGEREADEGAHGKPEDLELGADVITPAAQRQDGLPEGDKQANTHTHSAASVTASTGKQDSSQDAVMERRNSTSSTNAIEAAQPAAAIHNVHMEAETQGCSICTDDFEIGQDQRVLPCNHRFHPECVDPWLLNVSGTCPLCRIDLRPQSARSENGEVDEDGNPINRDGNNIDNLPPPLQDGWRTTGNRSSIRRSIVLGLRGMFGPDLINERDRAQAFRSAATAPADARRDGHLPGGGQDPEGANRRRRRFSMFNIRTRRTER